MDEFNLIFSLFPRTWLGRSGRRSLQDQSSVEQEDSFSNIDFRCWFCLYLSSSWLTRMTECFKNAELGANSLKYFSLYIFCYRCTLLHFWCNETFPISFHMLWWQLDAKNVEFMSIALVILLGSFIHRLRTPNNEGINQRYLKNWADLSDKICFGHT